MQTRTFYPFLFPSSSFLPSSCSFLELLLCTRLYARFCKSSGETLWKSTLEGRQFNDYIDATLTLGQKSKFWFTLKLRVKLKNIIWRIWKHMLQFKKLIFWNISILFLLIYLILCTLQRNYLFLILLSIENEYIVREIGNSNATQRKNWKQKKIYNVQRGSLLKFLKTCNSEMERICVEQDPLKICYQDITNSLLLSI